MFEATIQVKILPYKKWVKLSGKEVKDLLSEYRLFWMAEYDGMYMCVKKDDIHRYYDKVKAIVNNL